MTRLARLAEAVAGGAIDVAGAVDRLTEDKASFGPMTKEDRADWPGLPKRMRIARVGFDAALAKTMKTETGVVLIDLDGLQVTVESDSEEAGAFYAYALESAEEAEALEGEIPDPADAESLVALGFARLDT